MDITTLDIMKSAVDESAAKWRTENHGKTVDPQLIAAVIDAVLLWDSIFPGNRTDPQLALMAATFCEDMLDEGVSVQCFNWVAKRVRRTCGRFFPSSNAVMDAVEEYRTSPPACEEVLQVRYDQVQELTPEQVERNKEHVRICTLVITGKISAEDGARMHEDIINGEG